MNFSLQEVEGTIPERFARVARAYGERRATPDWTYGQLAELSDRMAGWMSGAPAGPVAILVPRRYEPLVLLAALKCGRPYAVLDPEGPAERRERLLADLQPGLVVSELAFGPATPDFSTCEAAAIVYTSGSTGEPLGVVRSHRCILHRAYLYCSSRRLGPGDVQSAHFSARYVAAEADLYGALLSGAEWSPHELTSLDLEDWLRGVTLWHPPMAIMRRFLQGLREPLTLPRLRLLALAGERVSPADLRLFRQKIQGRVAIEHRFSATETSNLTVFGIEPEDEIPDPLPAGWPVEGKDIRLDDQGRIVVRSRYLASGYWGRPDSSFGEEFVLADRGQWLPDGSLLHLGRDDGVIKIFGYRVERGEVETAIRELEGVREVAVRGLGAEPVLTAFVVLQEGVRPRDLQRALLGRLSEAWRPTRWVVLPALPLTATGKVDYRALGSR